MILKASCVLYTVEIPCVLQPGLQHLLFCQLCNKCQQFIFIDLDTSLLFEPISGIVLYFIFRIKMAVSNRDCFIAMTFETYWIKIIKKKYTVTWSELPLMFICKRFQNYLNKQMCRTWFSKDYFKLSSNLAKQKRNTIKVNTGRL